MKKMICGVLAALAMAGLPTQVAAHGFGGELTGGKADGVWGGELGVGYGLSVGPITVRPIAGAFFHRGDNNRYYRDSFANGESRCRDGANGRFASDRDCNNLAAYFYGKIEAAVSIAAFAELGVGARYSRETLRPYGLIALPIGPRIKVAGQVGDRYASAGLRLGF